ncbi:3'5'-cyclic nucleotide phosphodiesterase [Achlya hypogyna]|uniref:Phosphodiesterase n=1 Tax=Achlya hypogyna TaxID=1202772 RepID=A0A1V9YAG1_ACHHY|nr:3'5'-cyclic nucleotide phosphodiesterase [Achlya hypogyna]
MDAHPGLLNRLGSLPTILTQNASGRMAASPSVHKMELHQRLTDIEHSHLPLRTPESGAFDEKRLSAMSGDEYAAFCKDLGLLELRQHHAKLFKLVRQYQTLFTVASSISVEIDSGEALSRIVEGTYEVLEVEHVALFLISHKKQTLHLCVSRSAASIELPLETGILGFVVKHGESVIIQDVRADARCDPHSDYFIHDAPVLNMLCVPILDPSNNAVAVLQCANKPSAFTNSDVMSLELIASIAGHTLHKLELYEVAMLAGRKASAMLEVVRAIATELGNDLNGMIHKIVDVAKTALNCDRVSLFLCHRVKRELVCCVSYDPVLQRMVIPYGVGIAGYVAGTGEVLRVDNCYADPRFNAATDKRMDYTTVTALCAPVITHDNDMIAVIQAINKLTVTPSDSAPRLDTIIPFQDADVQMLTAFCDEIASSLRRSALETAYHQVLQGVNHMKRRDSVTLVVASLLCTHSQTENHPRAVKRHWHVIVFRAIGKFMRTLKRKRGVSMWIGPDQTSTLLLKGTLHATWNSAQYAFDDFSFNIFTCAFDQLGQLCVEAFREIGLFETFSVPHAVGHDFVARVASGYCDNPYHSWWHGVDVFQRCYALLNRTRLLSLLQPIHVFALLIASLTHDIGHPGTDNGFETAVCSPLAIMYNDISVLEQHHAAETFRILGDPKCNILVGLCKVAFQSIRKIIIDAILQTDMKSHFDLVHALEDAHARDQKQLLVFDVEDPIHVKHVIGSVLHAADIGAQAYPFDVAWEWSRRLVEEFSLLSAKERAQELPVAAFRANLDTDKEIATLQLNFINYIVTPLWNLMMEVFPGAKVLKSNLDCNRIYFQQGVAEGQISTASPRKSLSTLSLVPTKRLLAKKTATTHFTEQAYQTLKDTLLPDETPPSSRPGKAAPGSSPRTSGSSPRTSIAR